MTSPPSRQPWLGVEGLLFVVPIAGLLAFAGGPENAVRVFGPLVAFALTPVAAIAFWWNDWPGTRLRPAWSGWFDTFVIVALAIAFAVVGQTVVGHADLRGLVDPTPGPGHTPTFPALLPLGAASFTTMLQLTLVTERWPMRRLPLIPGGFVAMVLSLFVAVGLYVLLVDVHPPPGVDVRARDGLMSGAEFGALLTLIGVWQVWLYLAWRGWPFSSIGVAWSRRLVANVVILGGGVLSYLGLRPLVEPNTLVVIGGAVIAAGLTVSVLFEGSLRPHISAGADRVASVLVTATLTAVIYGAVWAYARGRSWPGAVTSEDWQAQAVSALSLSVILHVAVGRRWPFGVSQPAEAD
ncbi:MAG TPA: hypothetical protein VH442_19840 [Micromonosporaceae bacterium]